MKPVLLALAPLLLTGSGLAQDKDAPTAMPPTIHQAWLREVMDLDIAGAALDYQHIANGPGPGLDRWVAAARLGELRRLQVTDAQPPPAQDAPVPLRASLLSLQVPLQVEPLLDRARRAPTEGLQVLTTEPGKLPALRPAVPAAEEWLVGQIGPSVRDVMRQRLQTLANRSRSADVRRFTERLYAADILRAELQNRPAQASALRSLYFADWHPPTATGDPLPHLAKIRANLDAWLVDRELGNQQQAALRELKDALEKQAATDAAAALALVLRLPLYAERLVDATKR